MRNTSLSKLALPAALALASCLLLVAQPPQGKGPGGAPGGGKGGGRGPAGPVFTVTSPSFPDGGEVPRKHSFYGENKLPQFDFSWVQAGNPVAAPATLQTYVVIFHDIENATAKGPTDTLHWAAFNIPGTAKGLPEGMGTGDLPDGTRNGPGIGAGRGAPGYFGPGAGPGPFHHYVWEFYALDTKLDLPANTTRDEIMKGMEGHVIGKAAYIGRFHNVQ
ncbi:MAG: family phospholipid-binding protein [Bryobacterales bacterium]|jgi:Raf kinase inhibitor-like YbhB/YbcL family protein|nr:family phospholipid-binding protein [Bryobacterales bacterium]